MKKLSLEELVEQSKKMFASHPKENVFYATQDGQFFENKNKGLADNHNSEVVKGEVFEIKRPEETAKAEKTAKAKGAKDGAAE